MCLIKALLGGGRDNVVPSGSFSVVSWKRDYLSAIRYFKENNFELVGVMIFRCFTQVGRKCEYLAVFWNR
jgi:hypothetical protein